MKRIIVSGGIALLTIPSLCYYTMKYYINKTLTFQESSLLMFTILVTLIIIGLIMGFYNAYQISQLKKIIEEHHCENLEYHNNNREIMLDMENNK